MQNTNFFVLWVTNLQGIKVVNRSMNSQKILFTVLRFGAAVIMLQTLFYKFSASPESVFIFSQVGMEPWGRIAVGIGELIAAALLLYKKYTWVGALMSVGLMFGAIVIHLTMLGIEVMDDGGYLFFLAVIVFISSLILLLMERNQVLNGIRFLKK